MATPTRHRPIPATTASTPSPALLLATAAAIASLAFVSPACDSESTDPIPPGGSGGIGGEAPGGSGGSGGAAGEGGAGGAIGFVCGVTSLWDPECVTCVDDRCCDEARACAANAECPDWMSCYRTCPLDDEDCFVDCHEDYPVGLIDGGPLMTCEQRYCNSECEHPEDASCGWYLGSSPEDQACQACGMAECCDEGYERNRDPEVSKLFACWAPCADDDDDCLIACAAQHPDGYTKQSIFINCLTMQCTDECEPALEVDAPCGLRTPESGDPTCDACMQAECCNAISAVSGSEQWYQYLGCYYGCTDNACLRQCTLQHTWGEALNSSMWACVGTNCLAECTAQYSWLGPCGNIVNLDPACNLCMQTDCCDVYTELGVNPEGMAYLRCGNNVSTYDEFTQCRVDWADGYVLEEVSSVCRYDHCDAECNSNSPPCGRRFDDLPDCGTCVETECCAAVHDCMADVDCQRLELCRYIDNCALSDTACIEACRTAHPDSVALFNAYHACLTTDCATECADW